MLQSVLFSSSNLYNFSDEAKDIMINQAIIQLNAYIKSIDDQTNNRFSSLDH